MKNSVGIIIILLFAFQGFAQNNKFGATPQDSVECVKNLSLYTEFYKQKNYKDAYNPWKQALVYCPQYSKSLYIYGEKIVEHMIENTADEARKNTLIDSLMINYDMRMQHFGQKGYVIGKKGSAMLEYRPDDPKAAYDLLIQSLELDSNAIEAGALLQLFKSNIVMINKGQATREDVLKLYTRLTDVIDYNLANPASDKDKGIWEKVSNVMDQLVSKVADCEKLEEIFTPKFEENPTDQALVATILKLLTKNECTDSELYLKAAKAQCEVEPKFNCAYAIGVKLVKSDNCKDAIDYFLQAADLAENDDDKYSAYKKAALCYLKNGSYSNARAQARNMIKVNEKSGEAYLIIAQAYAASAGSCGDNDCTSKSAYWAAVDKCYQAKSVDPSVAEDANGKIASYSSRFPDKEKCFFHNITEGSPYTVGCWINESTKVRFKN